MSDLNTVGAGNRTSFLTDQYEIGNAQVALYSGAGDHSCVFELFPRRLPKGRRYGVFCGLERALKAISHFRFGEEEISYLKEKNIGDEETWAKLQGEPFKGNVWAYKEGEVYFPYSPLLRVEGSFFECVLLETVLLSIFNWDSGVASTGARMVTAAGGKPIIEMASRRLHELAAVDTARAAYVVGFTASSNLEAGRTFGVPNTGTAAHALTLVHDNENQAFDAQAAVQGDKTTFLVDTYDWREGIKNALNSTHGAAGGVRIDSGNLVEIVPLARELLNSLGAHDTKIVLSGGLDEFNIQELSSVGADGFGIGERLVYPRVEGSPGFTYKLVSTRRRSVAKLSEGKKSYGGRKWAYRVYDDQGKILGEQALIAEDDWWTAPGRWMQERVIRNGEICYKATLEEVRAYHKEAKATLKQEDLLLEAGTPRITCTMSFPTKRLDLPTFEEGEEFDIEEMRASYDL